MSAPPALDLRPWDLIVVSSSGGKDSQAMLHTVVRLAEALGVKDRLHVVHATFAEEWNESDKIARAQADAYGVPLHVVTHRRWQGSLLERVRARGRWPDAKTRYCTAEFKRNQVDRVITALCRAHPDHRRRQLRVLRCLGIRAAESPARKQRGEGLPQADGTPLAITDASRIRRVETWWPIFRLTTDEVWRTVREAATPVHPAYGLGMPRLSCRFCVFAPRPALILAGRHNPDLLRRYVEVEREIAHSFRRDLRIAEILNAVEHSEPPGEVRSWQE